jgi:predicted TIM-barrel fold metal-dependent hydrolase
LDTYFYISECGVLMMRVSGIKTNGQTMEGMEKTDSISKIDIHTHYLPEAYKEALLERGERNPDGLPTPAWGIEEHLEAMEKLGIAKSIISISSPHINFGDAKAAKILARRVNEEGAAMISKYPGKFGLFASLPLPDAEDSIEEINYAFDHLDVDGFTLPTNSCGVYLGDPSLDGIFEELDKRRSIVVLHPNKPGSVPQGANEALPIPIMEFFFDTTRTVTNMILQGVMMRYPNIKLVIPHAGAFLAILADRLNPFLENTPRGEEKIKVDAYQILKGLYYDVAGFCLPRQLSSLLQIVDPSHLFYGSDYPYTPMKYCISLAALLAETNLLTDQQRRAIYYDNALKLFPRVMNNCR